MKEALEKNNGLSDYKIYCFNGEPELILVCKDRFGSTGITEDYFTTKWEHLDIKRTGIPNAKNSIPRPNNLCELLKKSQVLSEDIPFLRVDFYEVNNQIFFGELTLFPASGFKSFRPECWDKIMGNWIKLRISEV